VEEGRTGRGTEFYLATGDVYATQQLLGHGVVGTRANIYVRRLAR
jgi:hypothetical protein